LRDRIVKIGPQFVRFTRQSVGTAWLEYIIAVLETMQAG
jgi:hypothetical protein